MGITTRKIYSSEIDALRVMAILAVIVIHTTTRTLEITGYNLVQTQWTLLLNQAARFAVPLFFMISGFVLELNYHSEDNYFKYLVKRLSRIAIPYATWSAIYFLLVYKEHTSSFWSALTFGSASHQLYFIPTLLIFYLIFPLLHRFWRLIGNRWVMIFLGLIQLRILYLGYFEKQLTVIYPIAIFLVNYFVFLLGMAAARNRDKLITLLTKLKYLLIPTLVVMIIIVFREGYYGYLQTHDYEKFYNQWRPSVLGLTIAVGGTLYYLFDKLKRGQYLIRSMAELSFFVFFIHVIVLENVWYYIGKPLGMAGQFWWDLVFWGLTTGISFAIAAVIHILPLLRKIVG